MTAAILGLVVATATGYSLVFPLTSPSRQVPPDRLFLAALAILLGVSAHSLWYLVWLRITAGSPSRIGYAAFDLLLPVIAFFVVNRLVRHRPRPSPAGSAEAKSARVWDGWSLVGLSLCAAGGWVAYMVTVALPTGGWDAWAIWNLKARWIALGGNAWSTFLTGPAYINSQPDYPLLVPLSIGRLWHLSGETGSVVSQGLSVGATVLLSVLAFAGVRMLRGPRDGAIAVAGILAIPHVSVLGGLQYADVPLACSYLAALLALAASLRGGAVRGSSWRDYQPAPPRGRRTKDCFLCCACSAAA